MGHWEVQAALDISNVGPLKVKENRNASKILISKCQGKGLSGRQSNRWKKNIRLVLVKQDVRVIIYNGLCSIKHE
jgi:RecB family endonuclease NucS